MLLFSFIDILWVIVCLWILFGLVISITNLYRGDERWTDLLVLVVCLLGAGFIIWLKAV